MSVKVTCTDEQTGESDTCVVADGDYLLIVTDPCYLHHTAVYKNGATHVLTVKGRVPR